MVAYPEAVTDTELDALDALVDATGLSYVEARRAMESGVEDPHDPDLVVEYDIPAVDEETRIQQLYRALAALTEHSRLGGYLRGGNAEQYGDRAEEVHARSAAKYARMGQSVRHAFMAANAGVLDPRERQARWRRFFERYQGAQGADARRGYLADLEQAAEVYDIELPRVK